MPLTPGSLPSRWSFRNFSLRPYSSAQAASLSVTPLSPFTNVLHFASTTKLCGDFAGSLSLYSCILCAVCAYPRNTWNTVAITRHCHCASRQRRESALHSTLPLRLRQFLRVSSSHSRPTLSQLATSPTMRDPGERAQLWWTNTAAAVAAATWSR